MNTLQSKLGTILDSRLSPNLSVNYPRFAVFFCHSSENKNPEKVLNFNFTSFHLFFCGLENVIRQAVTDYQYLICYKLETVSIYACCNSANALSFDQYKELGIIPYFSNFIYN